MALRIEVLTGAALAEALREVARLRIAVFRDWPYLYDGDLAYEERYLAPYVTSANAIVVGAFDGARLVGAATGTPMEDQAQDFGAAFAGTGLRLEDIFYFAESVLLPEYRGQGIGHAFFDAREVHARALGRRYAAFASVMRAADHPARTPGYRPLDPFWHKRGYDKLKGAFATFRWKDVGDVQETPKRLQIWMRELT